jgi:hypothetical protein
MGEKGMHREYWWESKKERDRWEDQDVSGWNLERQDGMVWIGLI